MCIRSRDLLYFSQWIICYSVWPPNDSCVTTHWLCCYVVSTYGIDLPDAPHCLWSFVVSFSLWLHVISIVLVYARGIVVPHLHTKASLFFLSSWPLSLSLSLCMICLNTKKVCTSHFSFMRKLHWLMVGSWNRLSLEQKGANVKEISYTHIRRQPVGRCLKCWCIQCRWWLFCGAFGSTNNATMYNAATDCLTPFLMGLFASRVSPLREYHEWFFYPLIYGDQRQSFRVTRSGSTDEGWI